MALKGDRNILDYDVTFFMNTAAEVGGVLSLSTAGSGSAMDNGSAVVAYAANGSGNLPIGFLGNTFVDYDLTKRKINDQAPEANIGTKATIYTKGWVVTDMIYPGLTIAAKDKAYLGPSGLLTNGLINAAATPEVGVFLSTKDENGYAKVSFNFPA